MTPNTFSVHFFVRSNRVDKDGFVPMYSKVIINGQVSKLSLNHKILPTEWDLEKEQAKQSSKSATTINNAIEAQKVGFTRPILN